MIDIDFLPNRYREQQAVRQVKIWQLAVVVIFGGAIAAAALGQFALRCSVARQVAQVEPHYAAAKNAEQRFAELQQQLWAERTTAELYAYLDHPWPRTQILAALARPLPPSLALGDLLVTKETEPSASAGFSRTEPPHVGTPEAGQSIIETTPAERDLNLLRDEHDRKLTVVYTSGVTTDSAALHRYVARLGADALFSNVDLRSFESAAGGLPAGVSKFSLRLVVRQGYGQRSGPTGAEPTSDADAEQSTESSRVAGAWSKLKRGVSILLANGSSIIQCKPDAYATQTAEPKI